MRLTQEESNGMVFSAVMHAGLLLLAFLVKTEPTSKQAFAFIEVSIGEFQTGSPSQMSDTRNADLESRKNPAVNPEQTELREAETKNQAGENTEKSADLARQTQDIQDNTVVKTPDTDKKNPEKDREQAENATKASEKDARQADSDKKGALNTGDIKGKTGSETSEQGTGEDEKLAAPYQLVWEGDIVRKPLTNIKPAFAGDMDAVITVRFQVRPDGTVGQMIPLKKMSPELEREVMKTLRTARFSALPSGAPQLAQWGTITFRFVLE